MNATTYAVDTAKNVMQVHWVEPGSGEIRRKKLARSKFLEFFAQIRPSSVVMEACAGAHYWGRSLRELGHVPHLLPAREVKAFVRGNKDDAADARAIWLAAQQPGIRRVPIKSCDQQAILSLHRVRAHWISVRTATVNMLRGLLTEFGVVLPRGKDIGLKALAERRAQIEEGLPATMNRLLDELLRTLADLGATIGTVDAQIVAVQKSSATARTLIKVPGIGVLGATALAAYLGDGSAWKNGREFAASLGLTPSHAGTGGKVRIGRMTKRGDPYLRTLMISGGRSMANSKTKPQWFDKLLQRRPPNVAVVAWANKTARMVWAMVAHGRDYQAGWVSEPPNKVAAA